MINHLLAEDESEDQESRSDFRDSRLSSISRPSWSTPLVPDNGEIKTKKNSLKLTSIQVTIPTANTSKRRPGVSPFTTYQISVEIGGNQWTVRRRYSDFYYVHKLLKSYVKAKELPKLPPKKYVGSSTSSAFVEERRGLLEQYLKKLVPTPSCWLRSDVVQFLDNPQNILMFTWNFERMQKMQELLGSMTVENQSQTAQLTNELENARLEVQVLKERISQMEMLFLQQATGAAANRLDTSVMNTLTHNPRLSLLKEEGEEDDDMSDGRGSSEDTTNAAGKTYAQALNVKSDVKSHHYSEDEDSGVDDDVPYQVANCPEISLTDSKTTVNVKPNEVIEILKLAKEEDTSDLLSMSSQSTGDVNPYILDYDVTDAVELQQRMVLMSRNLQHAVKLSNELLEEKFSYSSQKNLLSLSDNVGRNLVTENSMPVESVLLDSSDSILSGLLTFEDDMEAPHSDVIVEAHERSSNCDSENGETEIGFTFGDVTPDYVSSKCQTGWSKRLAGRMDEILTVIIPTDDSITDRMNIAHFVKSIISTSIGGQLFPVGSFCSKTFLPGGGIDMCSFLTTLQSESWFVRVNEALCISSMADNVTAKENNVSVRNVSFINADVKVVKSIINNVEVDISVNQISSLYAQALLDKIDNFVGEKHLFKRSCILIRMWCELESSRHTSNDVGSICDVKNGRLSNWSIMVMIIWVFNKYGKDIHTTFQALCGFLCYFSSFEWNKYAITVHGPVRVEDLSDADDLPGFYALSKAGGFIPRDILDSMRDRFLKVLEAIYNIEKKTSSDKISTETEGNVSAPEQIPFSESQCEFQSMMGVKVHSHYRRGVVNIMDPIQPKNSLTHSMDTTGSKALINALQGGKSSFIKLCLDSRNEMADAHEKLQELKANSPDVDPDTIALLSVRDIPLMRTFFENSTHRIAEISRGFLRGKALPPGVEEQEAAGYVTLKSNQRELELAMKHAELILGNIVTPEALARLIVYALEVKGPLPVGEVGKLLQEATGNENLASALKTAFKGLKKVLEGFQGIFHIGTDHPFNPLVSLTDGYIEKRDSNVLDDSAVAALYVFEPSPPPEPRIVNSESGETSGDSQFVQLGKKGKASSFKGDGRKEDGYVRDQSRSNSFGSSMSVDTSGSSNSRRPPSARSPNNKKYNNKVDQHGGIRLSAQEYQQYQQYQMHMMHEQQRYQQFLQQQHMQQQQQQQQSHGQGQNQQQIPQENSQQVHDVSLVNGDQSQVSGSPPVPPQISIPIPNPSFPGFIPQPYSPTQQQVYNVPPPHAGGYFYDQNSNAMYYPSTNAMAGMHPPNVMSTSPTAGPGVAIRRNPSDSTKNKPKSPRKNSSS